MSRAPHLHRQYRGFAGSLSRSANECFIEMFDTDLVTLPPIDYVPDWLLPPQHFFVEESAHSASSGESGHSSQAE